MVYNSRKNRAIIITIVFTSVLFLLLYKFDNKYTHPATQGADGLLSISQNDLEEYPLRFLTNGWAFYPDALLTPDDFVQGNPNRYMVYTFVGERTQFDGWKSQIDPHGSGTYVLRLRLPEQKTTYALELPEIFSAYKLYIDDHLIAQTGNPDPENYDAKTQNRMITFEASGKATILLAVSDFSHYYSGMIYPPIFGMPRALRISAIIRIGGSLVINTIGLVATLFAFYLGIRMRHKHALLFTLLSLGMCALTAYPFVHAIFEISVFPWYGIELFSGYFVTLMVIILHNQICCVKPLLRWVSGSIAAIICLFALCYGLLSAQLTVPIMNMFSIIVFWYKASVATYLLITAYFSQQTDDENIKPLLYASVIYATAFAWDRILPMYEPILGGWFLEWGSFVFVIAIGFILWRDVISAYGNTLAFAEQHKQVTRQLAMQTEYVRQLAEYAEDSRRINHDFRQHLRTIGAMASKNNSNEVLAYLNKIADSMPPTIGGQMLFCQNSAVDALLGYYYNIATNKGVDIKIRFVFPDRFPLNDVEICTVIGNLLENALEACGRQTDNERIVSLHGEIRGQAFFLIVENSYDGKIKRQGVRFLSRKSDIARLGIGLESVQKIIKSYHGEIDIFPQDTRFKVGITLPLK